MWISPLTPPGNFTLKNNNSLNILAFKSPLPSKFPNTLHKVEMDFLEQHSGWQK